MQYNYIAIEGNIGSGKTSFAKMLSEDLDAQLLLEQFAIKVLSHAVAVGSAHLGRDASWEEIEALKKQMDDAVRKGATIAVIVTAEDMAEVAVWFIEGAAHVTGEIMMVDSGSHLGVAPLTAR